MKINKLSIRKIIHPIVLQLMKTNYYSKCKMVRVKNPEKGIYDIDSVMDGEQSAIFVVNHSNCHDIPIVLNAIKKHGYVMFAKQPVTITDKLGIFLNGRVLVDRKDKKDCEKAKREGISLCKKGKNFVIFSEATWNLSPNKIMLPMYWGVIDIARESKRPIIPTILDYKDGECRVGFGEKIYIDERTSKSESFHKLEDAMSTLRWSMWEKDEPLKRKEADIRDLSEYIQKWPEEYPKLNLKYEKSVIRKPYVEANEVFAPIYKINEKANKKLQLKIFNNI